MARWASWIHKWLALLMAIQILFWFASGLFFAAVPIETVRSEHRIAENPQVALDLNLNARQLRALSDQISETAALVEMRAMMGSPVAIITALDGRQSLYDLETGERISPISDGRARLIAESHLTGSEPAIAATWVDEESTEYRGSLPAWRIEFEQANRAVYIAANTGQVTARRSTLWRTFDFLWSLHIMDFKNHQDFNTPLLIGATLLGLVIILTGFVMFPSRLGYNAWRRRRKRQRSAR